MQEIGNILGRIEDISIELAGRIVVSDLAIYCLGRALERTPN
jgi:hypothetical protein